VQVRANLELVWRRKKKQQEEFFASGMTGLVGERVEAKADGLVEERLQRSW
jgi:hypothetical protein